jgi:predicted Zn-dependent protease
MLEEALREASWGRPMGTSATYRDGISRVAVANSCGLRCGYVRTLSLATLTRSGNGGPTLHAEIVAPGPDPEGVMGTSAGMARLQPAGGDEEVDWRDLFIESPAAMSVVRHLLPELADEGAAGEDTGEIEFRRLASEAVTVVDDGLLPGGVGSAPFDGEGNPTGRLTLVKAGVRIDRFRPPRPGEKERPGCAMRSSYRDLPRPGGTNLFVAPGGRAPEEMMRGLEEGFLLAALEGDVREGRSGSAGSRWRGMGWEIRDGSCVGPCRRLIFRAEPAELLEGILEVSSRLCFSLRQGVAVGSPDLLIRRRR